MTDFLIDLIIRNLLSVLITKGFEHFFKKKNCPPSAKDKGSFSKKQ